MYNLSKNSKRGSVTRGQDDDDLQTPTMPRRSQAAETTKRPAETSVPGAVAVSSALDPAAVKQAAARDPARLAYAPAPPPSAAARFRASSPKKENHGDDIKQRYRNLNANQHGAPGAVKVSGIDGSTEFSINDSSFDANGMVMDASNSAVRKDPEEAVPVQGTTVTAQLAPTDDEVLQRAMRSKAIPVAAQVAPNHKKRWILLAVLGILALAGLGAGLGVALGGGGSSSGMAAVPPPTRADTCLDAGDGTFLCFKEAFPAEDVTTFFVNCPTNDEERIFECESCLVAGISDISELNENSPVCNGCILCGESVSFDCTNLFPGEECALQTCNGDCGKDPVPSPSPDTEATECGNTQDGEFICNKEDVPTNFLLTQFGNCPPGAENNVFECETCVVAFEDSAAGIDSATQLCNGCINCGDSVAFDCSNLFPGESCAVVDCNGECIG